MIDLPPVYFWGLVIALIALLSCALALAYCDACNWRLRLWCAWLGSWRRRLWRMLRGRRD